MLFFRLLISALWPLWNWIPSVMADLAEVVNLRTSQGCVGTLLCYVIGVLVALGIGHTGNTEVIIGGDVAVYIAGFTVAMYDSYLALYKPDANMLPTKALIDGLAPAFWALLVIAILHPKI